MEEKEQGEKASESKRTGLASEKDEIYKEITKTKIFETFKNLRN